MNHQLSAKLEKLPTRPGVYFHKSAKGEVLYVGKAAVLKNRVRQYFQNSRSFDNKTLALVNEIADVDWLETESEVDALFLESEMVKRYMPRFNVLLRDDKSQSFVRIDMKNDWPTVDFTRSPLDDGAEYFGPFYNSFALKKALRYLRRVFPYLTISPRSGQSRLHEDLGLSPKMSDGSEKYKANLRKLISYIKGNRQSIFRDLEKEMRQAAKGQDFEKAAEIRNKIYSLNELKRRVCFGDREFLDISKDKALGDLKLLFGLKKEPRRIEGFDISHLSGAYVVASMVVFQNGVSSRADYRKFKMNSQKNDDFHNMQETIFRRFSDKNLKAWKKPDLILVDGGKGQLKACLEALKKRGVEVAAIAIAKKQEEIVVHRKLSNVDVTNLVKNPPENVRIVEDEDFLTIILHDGQKSSGHAKNLRHQSAKMSGFDDLIKLFQRIRDESHRFAVSYHTVLRRNAQTKNMLEEIPGIGPKTRAKLLKKFGSVKAIGDASEDSLAKIVGEHKLGLILQKISVNRRKNSV